MSQNLGIKGYTFLALISCVFFMIVDLLGGFIHELGHIFGALTIGGNALPPYALPVPFFIAVMYVSLPPNASWLAQLWFWSAAFIFDIATALFLFTFVLPRVKSLHARLFLYLFFSRKVFGFFTFGCIIGAIAPGYGYGAPPEAEGWIPQPGCAYSTFTLLGQLPIFIPLAIGIVGIIYAVGFLFPKQAFKLFKGHFPIDTIWERFSLLMVIVWLPYIVAGLISHFVWGANLFTLALFSLMIPGLYDGSRRWKGNIR